MHTSPSYVLLPLPCHPILPLPRLTPWTPPFQLSSPSLWPQVSYWQFYALFRGVKCDGQFLAELLLGSKGSQALAEAQHRAAVEHFGEDAPVISTSTTTTITTAVQPHPKHVTKGNNNYTSTIGDAVVRLQVMEMRRHDWFFVATKPNDNPYRTEAVWRWLCAVCTAKARGGSRGSQMIMHILAFRRMQSRWPDTFGIAPWILCGWHPMHLSEKSGLKDVERLSAKCIMGQWLNLTSS